jgi:hypothetical protein
MLLFKVTNEYHLYDGDKAIATTIVGNPMLLPILSRKNCDEVFGVVDVEKLAFNYAIEIGILHTTLAYSKHFKAGFNKAMELNKDKLFTVEDMKKAIAMARKGSQERLHDGYGSFTQPIFVLSNTPPEEIIQSLQPTEIEVEMVMDDIFDGIDSARIFPKEETSIPMLDKDGCLILKKKL